MTTWPFKSIAPYQVQMEALRRAGGKSYYAYFCEMGLGKTLTVLAEFINLFQAGKVSTLIVICPNSVKSVWAAEMEKTGDTRLSAVVWPDSVLPPGTPASVAFVVVMNYEAVITMRGAKYLGELLEKRRCMLVLDESINIKNPRARRTRVLIAASQAAGYRRLLSGAPLVQGPHDLWAQLRFLGALTMTNFYAFRNHFCKMGGFQGKQVIGALNEAELNRMVAKCSFRARKDEWLDLPRKIYTTRDYQLTAEQTKHYKALAQDLMTQVGKETIEVQMVISAMVKMQQICSGFVLTGDHRALPIEGGNPKLALLDEILEEVSGKAIIFTMFRHTTQQLLEHLSHKRASYIMGDMPSKELGYEKLRFDDDPNVRYLIAQVQSAKYGHSFLGGTGDDRCATTIFYEHSYSLDNRIQAEDRNHRIGQDRSVVYIDVVGSKIERMIVKALQTKQNVATAVIDGLRHGEPI